MPTFQQKLVSSAQKGVIFVPGFGLTTEATYAQISKPPTMVRQTNDMYDTTAREQCSCGSCDEPVVVGDRVTQIDSMGAAGLITGGIPQELQEMISACVGMVEETHHAECAGINQTTTRSGRVTRAPVLYTNESWVGGSGFGGCDHYDWSFNGYDPYDWESKRTFSKQGEDLNHFVVTDDEPVHPVELQDDEEEWESGDETDEEYMWDPDCCSDCD